MINIKIFIVNGPGTSGKTTFETMVQKIAAQDNEIITIESIIDYVKQIAITFGWNGTKTLKDRKMLSDLKDTMTNWDDVPYKVMQTKIASAKLNGIKAIFIDSREAEDIKRFIKDYDALTILVQRDINIVYGNHADDNVNDISYDIIIDNSRGLKELQEEAQIFYETFIKEENE